MRRLSSNFTRVCRAQSGNVSHKTCVCQHNHWVCFVSVCLWNAETYTQRVTFSQRKHKVEPGIRFKIVSSIWWKFLRVAEKQFTFVVSDGNQFSDQLNQHQLLDCQVNCISMHHKGWSVDFDSRIRPTKAKHVFKASNKKWSAPRFCCFEGRKHNFDVIGIGEQPNLPWKCSIRTLCCWFLSVYFSAVCSIFLVVAQLIHIPVSSVAKLRGLKSRKRRSLQRRSLGFSECQSECEVWNWEAWGFWVQTHQWNGDISGLSSFTLILYPRRDLKPEAYQVRSKGRKRCTDRQPLMYECRCPARLIWLLVTEGQRINAFHGRWNWIIRTHFWRRNTEVMKDLPARFLSHENTQLLSQYHTYLLNTFLFSFNRASNKHVRVSSENLIFQKNCLYLRKRKCWTRKEHISCMLLQGWSPSWRLKKCVSCERPKTATNSRSLRRSTDGSAALNSVA